MHQYVAVEVQHPRIEYAGLLRLDRPNHRARELVTLREGQREALVEIVLVEKRKNQTPRRIRTLHAFHVKELPVRSASRTQIRVDGSYDGRGTARVALSVAGRPYDEVSIPVPPERTRAFWPVAIVMLFLLGAGIWWLFGGLTGHEEKAPAPAGEDKPTVEAPVEAPAEPRLEVPQAESGESDIDQPVSEPVEASEDEKQAADEGPTVRAGEPSGETTEQRGPSFETELPPEREFVVYFEPNETDLTASARSELREIAQLLREVPVGTVRIVGHTALFGTEEGRLEISRGRAENAYRFLRQEGYDPANEVVVAWEGSTDPVTRERGEQGLNRRVEVEVGVEEQAPDRP